MVVLVNNVAVAVVWPWPWLWSWLWSWLWLWSWCVRLVPCTHAFVQAQSEECTFMCAR